MTNDAYDIPGYTFYQLAIDIMIAYSFSTLLLDHLVHVIFDTLLPTSFHNVTFVIDCVIFA